METPFDGIRSVAHIHMLIGHYILHFVPDLETKIENQSLPQKHIIGLLCYFSFMVFFVLSGISSGIWFAKNKKLHNSCLRLCFKFYWERLSIFVPLTYIYYISFTMAQSFFISNMNILEKYRMKVFYLICFSFQIIFPSEKM